ncbi:MAG: hypothetical protein IJY80_03590 [Opitutales bacterium]|nr:hypothetical protein [Opitutales bacterium]
MSFEKITSRHTPRVVRLVIVRERAARVAEGVFLLEGLRELERALASGIVFTEFYFCPELIRNPLAEKVFSEVKNILPVSAIVELSRPAFEKISYREKPEGVLAVAEMRRHGLDSLSVPSGAGKAPLFLVAESI